MAALFLTPAAALGQTPGTLTSGNPTKNNFPNAPSVEGSLFFTGDGSNQGQEQNLTDGTTVPGNLYGGIGDGVNIWDPIKEIIIGATKNADGNKVNISGGRVNNNVFGGWSSYGSASGNTVTMTGGRVDGIVFGAWAYGGTKNLLENNSATVGGNANLRGNLYGAYSQGSNGTLRNNAVVIDGEAMVNGNARIIAGAYSALGANNVQNNTVTLKSGTVNNAAIYGGRGQGVANITGNTVNIMGGTIEEGAIYGGSSINGATTIKENTVNITGGTVNVDIYGGHSGGKSTITENTVTIGESATVTGDVYGGYGNSAAAVTRNTVNVDGNATLGKVYGGGVKSGSADVFSGNTLNKKSETATIAEAHNFENVNFVDYTGEANIKQLDTTASGSAKPGVILTNENEITFNGQIDGTGSLSKKGAGDLVLAGSGDNLFAKGLNIDEGTVSLSRAGQINVGAGQAVALLKNTVLRFMDDLSLDPVNNKVSIKADSGQAAALSVDSGKTATMAGVDVQSGNLAKEGKGTLTLTGDTTALSDGRIEVREGRLQLGDGGATGGAVASQGFAVSAGAALVYNHSNNITETQRIGNYNAEAGKGGGAVVQSGTGELTLSSAFDQPADISEIFRGGTEIESGTLVIADNHSYNRAIKQSDQPAYRSRSGYLSFTKAADAVKKIRLNATGASDDDTRPNVFSLYNSFRTQADAGQNNYVDLKTGDGSWVSIDSVNLNGNTDDKGGAFYVAGGTAMNVNADSLSLTRNRNGDGSLNDLYVEEGGVFRLTTGRESLFQSGIAGTGKLELNSSAADGSPALVHFRDSNDVSYTMGSTTVSGSGAAPIVFNMVSPSGEAKFYNEKNFSISGQNGNYISAFLVGDGVVEAGESITVKDGAVLLPSSTDFTSSEEKQKGLAPGQLTLEAPTVTLTDFGLAYLADLANEANNALLNIVSDQATLKNGRVFFNNTDNSLFDLSKNYLVIKTNNGFENIQTDEQLDAQLTAQIDGLDISKDKASPRGSYGFQFGGDTIDAEGDNVWFTQSLNSLLMDWTGTGGSVTGPSAGQWADNAFQSNAANNGRRETRFMAGDKVHISGGSGASININLPANASLDPGAGKQTVVSGLVVGRDSSGANKGGGKDTYIIGGSGGFRADASSAFGKYAEDGYVGDGKLEATGKLEKYGQSTLVFNNSGGNLFSEGVDLYGGTVQISRGDQLSVGHDKKITFKAGDGAQATLRSGGQVTLDTGLAIEDGATATLFTNDTYHTLLLSGAIAGENGSVIKNGEGIVQVGANSRVGQTELENGKFRVVTGTTYQNSQTFVAGTEATLAGGGTVQAEGITISGNLSPDGDTLSGSQTAVAGEKRYGALTLDGGAAGVDLSGFSMDFDVAADANVDADGNVTHQDLLKIKGKGGDLSGTINFHGLLPTGTALLVIQGEDDVTQYSTANGLTATINGNNLATAETPRGTLHFALGSSTVSEDEKKSSVWLTSALNSLTMNWQGGNGSTHGEWRYSDDSFASLQGSGSVKRFQDGDEVLVGGDAAQKITLNNGDTPMDVQLSRLAVGAQATGTQAGRGVDRYYNGDVTFDGSGSIRVDKSWAFGKYTKEDTAEEINNSGRLEKYGSGTLTFANAGGNFFQGGIGLYGGTVAFQRADQLTVGENSNITFEKGTSTLRSIAAGAVELKTAMKIAAGAIAGFRADNNGSLTLSGLISSEDNNDVSLVKSGTGSVILTNDANSVGAEGTVTVESGTLQLGNGENAGNIVTKIFKVAQNATLAYMHKDDTVTVAAQIAGEGTLEQKGGAGSTLKLTSDGNSADAVKVTSGTLQVGNGTTAGSIATKIFTVAKDAVLAYNHSDNVTVNARITGEGTLEQKGGADSTLILNTDGNSAGAVTVSSGTLQLGSGNTAGSIAAEIFTVAQDAVLAYKQSDTVVETAEISGAGKVVQRGDGTLTLNNAANSFTGGTEIESGALLITEAAAYGRVAKKGESDRGQAGYITFAGTDAEKSVSLENNSAIGSLNNAFRTAAGAGENNTLDLRSSTPVFIKENQLTDQGGVFYVADGTAMNVRTSDLVLGDYVNGQGLFNTANDKKNDLFIDGNGTFNLYTAIETVFNSGIDGTGALNLTPFEDENNLPYARVYLINSEDNQQTYHAGSTTVTGLDDKSQILYMMRGDAGEGSGDHRVVFENDANFTLNKNAVLVGEGRVTAGTAITIQGGVDGAAGLYPHITDAYGTVGDKPGALELNAPTIGLDRFVMNYAIDGLSMAQQKLTVEDGFTVSNNSLLDLKTGSEGNRVVLGDGVVFVRTTNGNAFTEGNYLVMRSDNGFAQKKNESLTDAETAIDETYLNDHLKASFDGFTLNTGAVSVRGGDGVTFKLGSDPGNVNDDIPTINDHNIWLTTAALNSLSMTWKGTDDSGSGTWASGEFFESEQVENDVRESHFMPGDKVYLSNSGEAAIDLQASFDPVSRTNVGITVSGLVVGKDTEGEEINDSSVSYTFSGAGGLLADAGSAHGKYVDKVDDDDIDLDNYHGIDNILNPTGKLQKYGNSTLTFKNTGGNAFMEGIELAGGITQFTDAMQLFDNSYDPTCGYEDGECVRRMNAPGEDGDATASYGTHIMADSTSTLEALNNVLLQNAMTIEDRATAIFKANGNTEFNYVGELTGGSGATLDKSGTGLVRLATLEEYGGASEFDGRMTVNDGTLDVIGTYEDAEFAVYGDSGAGILSGTGFLGSGTVHENGTLKPGTLEVALNIVGDLIFEAGGKFNVRLGNNVSPADAELKAQLKSGGCTPQNNHGTCSDYVTVSGETRIDSAALLELDIDYWGGAFKPGDIYRIIEGAQVVDKSEQFTLATQLALPRGLRLEQGWNLKQPNDSPYEYQLMLARDYNNGVDDIPGLSHDENEIGKIIDNMLDDDPDGPMQEIVERVTGGGSDDEVRRQLNQLTGDLTANALHMAFKEPWRHPFNRLNAAAEAPLPVAAPAGGNGLYRPRLWAEYSAGYEEADFGRAAHGFSLQRYGLALGVDTGLTSDTGTVAGLALRYTNPQLKQDTGRAEADDFEIGLYALQQLGKTLNLKAYLGYSNQSYAFHRSVSLPATGQYGALRENLKGRTDGEAVAASLELVKTIQLRDELRLLPVAALDYEKAWMDGYRESAGLTALSYEDSEMERLTFRFGLGGEYQWRDELSLKARAQYLAQIGGQEHPAVSTRFLNAPAQGQAAEIWGGELKGDYVNLGLGLNWAPDGRRDQSLYINYDAKFNDQASRHQGEAGFLLTW